MSSSAGKDLVPVLLYHDVVTGRPTNPWQVNADALAADLDAVLRCGRTVVTGSVLDEELAFRPDRSSQLCALTFDDGYASFAELVMPLLAERRLPASLYVTTGQLGQPAMLSEREVRAIADEGIEIGAHSVHHPHLDLISPAAVRAEVRDSGNRVGDLLGRFPTGFAYPHGSFNRRVRDLVVGAGYANAYAVKDALTHTRDDGYARARLTVLADTGRHTVETWLAGRGAPPSWRRERLRTKAFRHVRAVRARLP